MILNKRHYVRKAKELITDYLQFGCKSYADVRHIEGLCAMAFENGFITLEELKQYTDRAMEIAENHAQARAIMREANKRERAEKARKER